MINGNKNKKQMKLGDYKNKKNGKTNRKRTKNGD